GTIVLEGVRIETGGELDILDCADEFGRQLSSVVENIGLLEQAIRRRGKSSTPADNPGRSMSSGELRRMDQSDKLAALGQPGAGMAHELNNPLQGVLGHLELLKATGETPKALHRQLQTIYREADRAAKIVRNLLMFAGARRMERRPVSLNAVLKKVLALRLPT